MSSLVSLTLKDHTNLCSVLEHLLALGDSILESITLLLHSENAKTIILMQCFVLVCLDDTIIFCMSLQGLTQHVSKVPQWGRIIFFVRSKKCECLNHLLAGHHHLWQPCTVQMDFYQSQETNGLNPVLSYSCNVLLRTANYHQKWHFCGSAI